MLPGGPARHGLGRGSHSRGVSRPRCSTRTRGAPSVCCVLLWAWARRAQVKQPLPAWSPLSRVGAGEASSRARDCPVEVSAEGGAAPGDPATARGPGTEKRAHGPRDTAHRRVLARLFFPRFLPTAPSCHAARVLPGHPSRKQRRPRLPFERGGSEVQAGSGWAETPLGQPPGFEGRSVCLSPALLFPLSHWQVLARGEDS